MKIKEMRVQSVITKSNLPVCDYSVNPYVGCEHACKYCYASFMKRFTGHTEKWGEFIDVKFWQPIKNAEKYRGKEFFIGSVTDPYQPSEEKYQRTRAFLEEMQGSGAAISIATKSDLVLRDINLLKTFQSVRVSFSINTLSEDFRADMDKGVSIERRFAAMKKLREAGIRTTCFISPIFPEITDVKAIIERAKNNCNLIWLENLNLRGSFKPAIMAYIGEKHSELMPLYEEIYNRRGNDYWRALDEDLRSFADRLGLEYKINDDTFTKPFSVPPTIVNYFYHFQIKKSAQKHN